MDKPSIEKIAREIAKSLTDNISLESALALSKKVRTEAARIGVKAVVAVADCSGQPICVEKMDDAYIASYDIAVNKAFTCAALKMSTADLKPLAQPGASLYGIQFTNNGKIVIFGGGEPLYSPTGKLIGAVGVSGGSEAEDTSLAAYAKQIFEKGGI